MDDYVEPVVQEKPMRGREMKTNIVPTDMFDTMKLFSSKKTHRDTNLVPELQTKSEKTAELYHEGYVDGKLYLVPDSNLEAMRDMINFKMKPRRSTRYKHQTSFELTDYDHFRGKLHTLLEKIEEVESESEEEEDEEEEKEEEEEEDEKEEEEEKEEAVEEEKEEEKVEEEKEEEKLEEEIEEEKVEEEKEEEQVEEEIEEEKVEEEKEETEEEEEHKEELPLYPKEEKVEEEEEEEEEEKPPLKPMAPNCLRFLISGHFQKGKKPIYIIQDYRGGPDLFKDQKADFYTKQKEDDVDLCITGRFYDERILEEHQGKPKALNIKPYKILIDEKTSNVYDDYFEQVYKFNSADVSLKGEFIKSKITKKITPFLTLDVKQKYPAEPNIKSEGEKNYHGKPSTAVLVYKPEYNNPFAKGDKNQSTASVFNGHDTASDALVLQSTIAVMPALIDRNEHPSNNKVDKNKEDKKRSKPDINECDLKTIVSVKPYDIFASQKLAKMINNNTCNREEITKGGQIEKISSENTILRQCSRDLEDEYDCNRKKLKKKRKEKSLQRLSTTTESISFPILQDKKTI